MRRTIRTRVSAPVGHSSVVQQVPIPIPLPLPPQQEDVPFEQNQENQMELHSVEHHRIQSDQQTETENDTIHTVISPLSPRPTQQHNQETDIPLVTECYRSPFTSHTQTRPVIRQVAQVTTASAMFVFFLCDVAGLPHSHLKIAKNWVNSKHDHGEMWQTIGQHIVEISIFQLKTKNGYLTLRILVQTFQDCHPLRTASTQS